MCDSQVYDPLLLAYGNANVKDESISYLISFFKMPGTHPHNADYRNGKKSKKLEYVSLFRNWLMSLFINHIFYANLSYKLTKNCF